MCPFEVGVLLWGILDMPLGGYGKTVQDHRTKVQFSGKLTRPTGSQQ